MTLRSLAIAALTLVGMSAQAAVAVKVVIPVSASTGTTAPAGPPALSSVLSCTATAQTPRMMLPIYYGTTAPPPQATLLSTMLTYSGSPTWVLQTPAAGAYPETCTNLSSSTLAINYSWAFPGVLSATGIGPNSVQIPAGGTVSIANVYANGGTGAAALAALAPGATPNSAVAQGTVFTATSPTATGSVTSAGGLRMGWGEVYLVTDSPNKGDQPTAAGQTTDSTYPGGDYCVTLAPGGAYLVSYPATFSPTDLGGAVTDWAGITSMGFSSSFSVQIEFKPSQVDGSTTRNWLTVTRDPFATGTQQTVPYSTPSAQSTGSVFSGFLNANGTPAGESYSANFTVHLSASADKSYDVCYSKIAQTMIASPAH